MGFARHARVELPGDVVFDGVNQRLYDRVGYQPVEKPLFCVIRDR